MNIKDARYIIAIAEEKTLSQAASVLYVSQSTLSHALSRIESELGTTLFDRSKTPLQITDAGQVCLETAREMVLMNKNMANRLKEIKDSQCGTFRLGLTSLALRCYFPLVFPKVHRKFPDWDFILTTGSISTLQEDLDKGRIDAAIMVNVKSSRYNYIPLLNYSILLAAPASKPIEKKEGAFPVRSLENIPRIHFSSLADEKFIMTTPGQQLYDISVQLFNENGMEPHSLIQCGDMETIHDLIGKNIGVSLLPDIIIPHCQSKKVQYYRIDNENLDRTLAITFMKGKFLPRVMREFIPISREEYFKF